MMNNELPKASEADRTSLSETKAAYREIIVKSLGEMINMMSAPMPLDHTFMTVASNCASMCYHVMGMLVRDISAQELAEFSSIPEAADYIVRQLAATSLDRERVLRVADAATYIAFDALDQTKDEFFAWIQEQGPEDMIEGDFPLRQFLSQPPTDGSVAAADATHSADTLSPENPSDAGK